MRREKTKFLAKKIHARTPAYANDYPYITQLSLDYQLLTQTETQRERQ